MNDDAFIYHVVALLHQQNQQRDHHRQPQSETKLIWSEEEQATIIYLKT